MTRPGSSPLDPRLNAFRDNLADTRLRGRVEAPAYADGEHGVVTASVVALRRQPDAEAARDTEALFGESIRVFDVAGDWAWVQLEWDGYVGYLEVSAIGPASRRPTHRIRSRSAIAYAEPSAVTAPVRTLPMNGLVTVVEEDGPFAALAEGGFAGTAHLAAEGSIEDDFVAVAEGFVGVPYLFGGRSWLGIDCSGLVQMSLAAAGVAAPRDSDMQQSELGDAVEVGDDLAGLMRGDLVFWPGHVAIMINDNEVVHATATHMSVLREAVSVVADRARKDGPRVAAVRRLV